VKLKNDLQKLLSDATDDPADNFTIHRGIEMLKSVFIAA
jgi:hypothetical protein